MNDLEKTQSCITQVTQQEPNLRGENVMIAKDIFLYRNTTERGILPYSVLKLYKRELLAKALGQIGNDIVFAEDSAILFGIVFQNIRICIADESYYHYYIRKDSVCRAVNPDYLTELTAFYKYTKKIDLTFLHKGITIILL